MAERVVDELELVEIEEEQRIQVAAAPRPREFGGGQFVEQHAVGDAGQVIVRGELVGAALFLFQLLDQAALLALGIQQLLVQETATVRHRDQAAREHHHQQRNQDRLQVILPVRRPQLAQQYLLVAADHHRQRIVRQPALYTHVLGGVARTQCMDEPIALAGQQEGGVLLAGVVGAAREDAPGQLGQLQPGGVDDLDAAGTIDADLFIGLEEIAQIENGGEKSLQRSLAILQRNEQRHAPAVAVAVQGRLDDHLVLFAGTGERTHETGIDETAQFRLALLACRGIDQPSARIEHGHAQVGRVAIEERIEIRRGRLFAIEHGLPDARIQQGLAQHFIQIGRDNGGNVAAVGYRAGDGQLFFILDADQREIPQQRQRAGGEQHHPRRHAPAREQSGQQPLRLER